PLTANPQPSTDLRQRDPFRALPETEDGELRGELLRGSPEGLRRGGFRFADADRDPGVAADPDGFVDRDAAEERHRHLFRELLAPPLAEVVALGPARRADEVAHVLDETERRNAQLLEHLHGPPRVGD